MFDNFLCEDSYKKLSKIGVSFRTTSIPSFANLSNTDNAECIDRFRRWHIEQHKPPAYGFGKYEGVFRDIAIQEGGLFVSLDIYHNGSPEEHTLDDWKEIVLSIRRDMELDMGLWVDDILGLSDDSDRQAGSLRMIELYVFESK